MRKQTTQGGYPSSNKKLFNRRDRSHSSGGFHGNLIYKGLSILSKQDIKSRLFEEQDGRCAICPEFLVAPYNLDHDHLTGEIRGLLCRECNLGLGAFRDDPILLAHAIEYLIGIEVAIPEPR